MSSSMDQAAPTAQPQQPWVQPEWADRSVNQWLPESVFKHSLVCTLSFLILFISLFFRITHLAATRANCKADENQEQSERGCRMSGFVCRRDLSYQSDLCTANCVFVGFRCTITKVHFLTRKSSLIINKMSSMKFLFSDNNPIKS